MATVVIDSSDHEAISADARGELKVETPKEEPKEASKEAPKEETKEDLDAEGEDGLTARQKQELTAKMQSAIGKKHRALKEAEEFAAEQYNERRLAEQRAANLEQQLEELRKANEPKAVEPTEPKRENYQSDKEYQDAYIDYRADLKFKAAEAEREKKAAQERQEQILAQAAERIEHAKELVPDFDEVTGDVDWPTPPAIAGYMQESEMFAELGYYLAQHAEERTRLEKLTPARQLVEIGKIESKLQPFSASKSAEKANGSEKPSPNGDAPSETVETPKVRTAPVIKPLSSHATVVVAKDERDMTPQEALRHWAQKKHVNLTKRSRH